MIIPFLFFLSLHITKVTTIIMRKTPIDAISGITTLCPLHESIRQRPGLSAKLIKQWRVKFQSLYDSKSVIFLFITFTHWQMNQVKSCWGNRNLYKSIVERSQRKFFRAVVEVRRKLFLESTTGFEQTWEWMWLKKWMLMEETEVEFCNYFLH